MADVLSQLGEGGGRVWVWRRREDGTRLYLTKVDAELFDLDAVRETFGGGHYQFRIQRPNGTWRGGVSLWIDGAPKSMVSVSGGDDVDDAPAWAAELRDAIRDLRAPASTSDPLKIAAELGGVAANQMGTMLTMFTALLERQPKPSSGSIPAQKLLDAFTEGLRIGQGERNGAGSDSPSLAAAIAPRFLSIVENAMANSPRQVTDGQPIERAGGQLEEWAPADDGPFAALAPFMPRLHALALRGSPVDVWAAVIEDQHPEAVSLLDSLYARIGLERTAELLFETFPGARQRADWYRALLTALHEPPEEGGETEPDV